MNQNLFIAAIAALVALGMLAYGSGEGVLIALFIALAFIVRYKKGK